MKKNDFGQIKAMDIKELMVKARAIKAEMGDLILDKNMNKLKDLKKISKKRKDLAQMLTVIRQRELLVQLESKMQKEDINKSVIPSRVPEGEEESSTSSGKIATGGTRQYLPRNDNGKRSKEL